MTAPGSLRVLTAGAAEGAWHIWVLRIVIQGAKGPWMIPSARAPYILKAAVHWMCVNALSTESSPKLTWDAMGLRADSARWLSVRAEPLTR